MKHCPKCLKTYPDETLNFCLDDGEWLTADETGEPATAILHETNPSESATRAQIHTTARSGEFVPATPETPAAANRFSGRNIAAAILLTTLVAGAFFGFRYFRSTGTRQITSIAVLPFQNRNSDPDSDYLSDGLAESLIYRLSQIPDLKVSPRSSAFRYKGQDVDAEKVGSDLGVDAVMSGRVVQRGDNLTISVDLVDVRNNKTLWGEQFER